MVSRLGTHGTLASQHAIHSIFDNVLANVPYSKYMNGHNVWPQVCLPSMGNFGQPDSTVVPPETPNPGTYPYDLAPLP